MASLDFLIGALAVLVSTSLGAAAILAFKQVDRVTHSTMLAFSAGVMGFTTVEMFGQAHNASGDLTVAAGFAAGLFFILAMDKLLPHIHLLVRKKHLELSYKKAALLAGSISIHNIPEGLAIASAFAGSNSLGWLVTASMALQDIPEGFLVSAPLAAYGVGMAKSLKLGILSGVVEFAAAVAGYFFLSAFAGIVPFALAFSSGAMAYVIFVELLPDAWKEGERRTTLAAFATGASLAFGLASLLGF